MGSFTRTGSFVNRDRFLEGLKLKLEKLMGGSAQGMTSTWEKSGEDDVGRLQGFGAKVEVVVGAAGWKAAADLPPWLPIPQSMIESKFDEKFAELSRL